MRVMQRFAIVALGAALCWPGGVSAQAPADTATPTRGQNQTPAAGLPPTAAATSTATAPAAASKQKPKRTQAQLPPATTQQNNGARKSADCLSQQGISYINCPGSVPSADTGPHGKDVNVKAFGPSGVQSAPGGAASDIRLKFDIAQVGELDNGIKLYRFRYFWSDQIYVGVMAQQVAAIAPQAVVMNPDGYLAVYYDRLGLKMQTLQEWQSTHWDR
jgi:hypothetical protein